MGNIWRAQCRRVGKRDRKKETCPVGTDMIEKSEWLGIQAREGRGGRQSRGRKTTVRRPETKCAE